MSCSRRGRAPKEGTEVALRYLDEYARGYKNRAEAVASLLSCSLRTAKRLLSKRKPYQARIRVEWAYLICAAVGKPPIHILGAKGPRLFSHVVTGWHRARSKPESLEMASDCACGIAARAAIHYGLTGHFSVSYLHGWVNEVVLYLSPAPELAIEGGEYGYHRLVITAGKGNDGVRRMWVQHIDPRNAGATDREVLDGKYLRSILHSIYESTKKLPRKLIHESNRRRTPTAVG